jgi:hypothetical protein
MSKLSIIAALVIGGIIAAALYFYMAAKSVTSSAAAQQPVVASGETTPETPVRNTWDNITPVSRIDPLSGGGAAPLLTKGTSLAGGSQNAVSLPSVAGNVASPGTVQRGIERTTVTLKNLQYGDYFIEPDKGWRNYYLGLDANGVQKWMYVADQSIDPFGNGQPDLAKATVYSKTFTEKSWYDYWKAITAKYQGWQSVMGDSGASGSASGLSNPHDIPQLKLFAGSV